MVGQMGLPAALCQFAILLRRLFPSRTTLSPSGDDPAILCPDCPALGVREAQGEPKGIGHCLWIVERSQEPVPTGLDPLPDGWEVATDRDGPGRHSFEKAVRRPVMIGDRDTHLGSAEEGKHLTRRAFSRDNDLVPQLVMFDRAPESRIVGGVDEHHTHTGIEVGRQEGQCLKQDLIAHVRTTAPCIHDKAVTGPRQITELRCQSPILSHARKVNTAPTRQDGRWGGWPEPTGPSQVDVALAVGKQ